MHIQYDPTPHEQTLAQIRAIYIASFPPAEREPWDDIRARVVSGGSALGAPPSWRPWSPPPKSVAVPGTAVPGAPLLYTAQEADAVVAFALITPLAGTRAFLLEYIAVAPEHRGRGYGGLLLRHLAADLRASYLAAGLLLEVEPPDQGPQADRPVRQRRLRFYQRHGARIIPIAYHMPNLAGPGSLPMLLLWLPLSQRFPPSGAHLADYITYIYTDIYRRPPDDPLLTSILRTL